MITILAVGKHEDAEDLDRLVSRDPSLELLHAKDIEEALDRLARNRRIDAVLLLVSSDAARGLAQTILQEDPAAPPIFAPAFAGRIENTIPVEGKTLERVLEALLNRL